MNDDMTPPEAADRLADALLTLPWGARAAAHVLIDHARAAAPAPESGDLPERIAQALHGAGLGMGRHRTAELAAEIGGSLQSAPGGGDLASLRDLRGWVSQRHDETDPASEKRNAYLAVCWEIDERVEGNSGLCVNSSPAPASVAAPPREDEAPELWWHPYAGVIERGRNYPDLYFTLGAGEGPITTLDALPDGAVRLAAAAPGTVHTPERDS